MGFSTSTVAITVSFNPDIEVLDSQFLSTSGQCKTIVIDNGSEKEILEKIGKCCDQYENVELRALSENLGISAAQNIVIHWLRENSPGVGYVLLLDHDSVPSSNMVSRLEQLHTAQDHLKKPVAAAGPMLFDPRDQKFLGFHVLRGFRYVKVFPDHEVKYIECISLNSSGSLISMKALADVGLLDEHLFMDHGETEWCFRARSKGFQILGAAGVEMHHTMGDDVCSYWLFGARRMPYRSPARHYYIVRNGVYLQKKPYVPMLWKLWNIGKLIFTYMYFGFISADAKAQRRAITQGFLDGVRGVTGKRPIS